MSSIITKPAQLTTVKMLVYGDSGVGKTRLVAQVQDVPEWSPILFVSSEAGTLSIRHRSVDVAVVTDDKSLSAALKLLKGSEYRSLVIDSLTLLQKILMRSLMKITVLNNPKMTDEEVPSMREWGIISERLQKLLLNLSTSTSLNIFITCLERLDKDEVTGRLYFRPDLPGRLPNYICAWADIVARLVSVTKTVSADNGDSNSEGAKAGTRKDTVRALLLQPGANFLAKDRTGLLGRAFRVKEETVGDIDSSSMPDLYAAIFG